MYLRKIKFLTMLLALTQITSSCLAMDVPYLATLSPVNNKTKADVTATQPTDSTHSPSMININFGSDATVVPATANFTINNNDWVYTGCSSTPTQTAADSCPGIQIYLDPITAKETNIVVTFAPSILNTNLDNKSNLNITLSPVTYPDIANSKASVDILIDGTTAATANFSQVSSDYGITWTWKYDGCSPAENAAVNICESIKVAVDATTSTASFTVSPTKPWKEPVDKKKPLYKLIDNNTAAFKLQKNKSTSDGNDSSVAIVDNNNQIFATLNFSFNEESGWAFTQCQQGNTTNACSMINTSISPFADIKMQQTITINVDSMYKQTFQKTADPNYTNESSVCISTQSGEPIGTVAPGESIAWPASLGNNIVLATENPSGCNATPQYYTVASNPGSFEVNTAWCYDQGDNCSVFDKAGKQLQYIPVRSGAASETPRMSLRESYNRQQQRAQQPTQSTMQQAPTTARQAEVRNKIASFRERFANVKKNVR